MPSGQGPGTQILNGEWQTLKPAISKNLAGLAVPFLLDIQTQFHGHKYYRDPSPGGLGMALSDTQLHSNVKPPKLDSTRMENMQINQPFLLGS